jgi:hypothetical protein
VADSKITDLTLRTRSTIVPTDSTVVVDISDTTMDASGTNVEVTVGEFVASGINQAIGKITAVNARTYF